MKLRNVIESKSKAYVIQYHFFFLYFRILEIDRHHVQGQHNLCVVHVERGDYVEGQACLEKALLLAPREQYIHNHLKIVKNKIAQLDRNKG